MKPEPGLQKYDVLQVSRDSGATWADFSTLRDEADFAQARLYVRRPEQWASQNQATARGYEFRVVRALEAGRVILARDSAPARVCDACGGPVGSDQALCEECLAEQVELSDEIVDEILAEERAARAKGDG